MTAVDCFERAVAVDPSSGKAWRNLAVALSEQGRFSEAVDACRRALECSAVDVEAFGVLARLKTFSVGDPDLVALEALAREERGLGERDLIRLGFTLAKAYEDLGEYERSFGCLRRANELRRASYAYDVGADVDRLARIAAAFGAPLFERLAGAGSGSPLPVLVVGMPRSGTSLVEQILASHPAVHGAGEVGHLRELVGAVSLLNQTGVGFPDGVAQLAFDDFARLGEGYVRRLAQIAPDAQRVIDKNNWNFERLGFARLAVPRARAVHVLRQPLDACFSCYSLPGEVEFASDLGELGRYHRAYAELMAHWREVLPEEWMLEVSYEALVSDLEREARRIVSHCGLDWDDRCLSFHTTQRTVRTASFAQVRQPVYTKSVDRWRAYELYLGPLIAALGG